MSVDNASALYVRDAVNGAQVDGVHHSRPGACEIELSLDLSPIVRQLKR